MKKTALTMTDSEKLATEKAPELTELQPKTHKEENRALRNIVEQQEIAMNMIMTKYREQVDHLTKVSYFDIRKMYYKRFLGTIVDQANKMNEMTAMMRKNLLIIFKYEEVMRELESENESLRALVRKLTLAAKEAGRKADGGEVIIKEAESQTQVQVNAVSTEDKSVGTSMAEFEQPENDVIAPQNRERCTDMVTYTPFSDSFAYLGAIHDTLPPTKPLDADAAFDSHANRFGEETQNPVSGDLHNIAFIELDGTSPLEMAITEKDNSSEELVSSARGSTEFSSLEVEELSSENSVVSLTENSCSKDYTGPDFDDVP